jgi:tRNA-Thr(GGU) m(6)t(6)A37 methyltransferase TsaA
MNQKLPDIVFKPIGTVSSEVADKPGADFDWWQVVSRIVVDESLSEALDSLDEFSHIIVIYWLHKSRAEKTCLKVHPRGDKSLPLVGLFASRSPHRPNPVGEKTVRLLKRQGNVLWVEGLDAIDGTPVIDIKPFIPGYDSPVDARTPQWNRRHRKDC